MTKPRHRKLLRMKGYDYSSPWWYFVTICTQDTQEYLGAIKNNKMILNACGNAVKKMWLNIPEHYPSVELDEYVIMPNHVHGIIIINNNDVGNENIRSLHKTNLSNVIKGFKIGVTKWAHQNEYPDFKWQKSFNDRIIRNERELYNIRRYILNNPMKWEIEKFPDNLEI